MMKRRQEKGSPVYMISVVSRILEVHPQTLRMYEKEGFVCPHRINRQRLYSEEDLERLNLVIKLTRDMGVNRAGVDIVLRMRKRIQAMQDEMAEMMRLLDDDVRRTFEKRLQKIFTEE